MTEFNVKAAKAAARRVPLVFWAQHKDQLCILARIADRLLHSATLFSISGKICSPNRSALTTKSIERLTIL
jgi:hypothetical protein